MSRARGGVHGPAPRWRCAVATLAIPLALGAGMAGSRADPAMAPDAGLAGASPVGGDCDLLASRIARRKAWLAARRQEQFARGGPPDPARGIANAVGLWCEAHPGDEECALGSTAVEVESDDLAYHQSKTPEDYDAHVVAMTRQLKECRDREKRRR